MSYISYHDVAAFAVQSLEAPAAKNATLELGGPQAVSQLEAVDIFEHAVAPQVRRALCTGADIGAEQQAAATDPMQQSPPALMRCLAHGDAIEMHATRKAFPIHLTSVKDYAASLLDACTEACSCFVRDYLDCPRQRRRAQSR